MKIPSKFNDFRQGNLFIDAIFNLPINGLIKCHRIVLSKMSSLFKSYFSTHIHKKNLIDLKIPFIADEESFIDIINYMYTGKIVVSEKNIIHVYTTACLLDVTDLIMSLDSILLEIIDNEGALNCASVLKSILANEINITEYPEIQKNFEKLNYFMNVLAECISKRIDIYKKEKIIASLTPRMLSKFLHFLQSKVTDDEKIEIIDEFVKKNILKESDREDLTNIFDWTGDSYLHFAKHRLEWATDSVSRECLGKILANRFTSFEELKKQSENFEFNSYKRLGVLSMLEPVCSSKGLTGEVNEDLLYSISTIWGTVPQMNPARYGVISTIKDTTYPMANCFTALNMFVDDGTTYVSASELQMDPSGSKSLKRLNAGIDFEASVQIQSIVVEGPAGRQPEELTLECIDDNMNVCFSQGIKTGERIEVGGKAVKEIAISKTKSLPFVLRIGYVRVSGRFLLC